jgi:iron complex transport system ATP-binding protein
VVLTLTAENLTFGYGAKPVLDGLTLPEIRSGEVTALLGPNATGKSTLLKCLAGLETPSGTMTIRDPDGGPATPAPDRRTRRRGEDDRVLYLPQDLPPASSLTVFEAVLLARQQRGSTRVSRAAADEVEQTLTRVGIADLATRPLSQLSGGQRQMLSLAQAVVRRPAVLLLDEPTSNLDLRNQLTILDLVRSIATTQPAAVLVTVHDLNLAARFAEQVVVLHGGGVYASGPPRSVITEAMLREIYQIDATVQYTADGTPTLAATRSR